MKIYYAHCTAIYHTPQEGRDIELLHTLFDGSDLLGRAEVINPSSPAIADMCTAIKLEVGAHNAAFEKYTAMGMLTTDVPLDASHEVMVRVFKNLAQTCDLLVFRALPDGRIPAGVFKEIQWAVEAAVPVMELPSGTLSREMTVTQTRQYLKEIGQR